MSQTRLNNVSATQSEKLSPRLLKSPPTMTSKQPAVFLTRYVWSRNRPVCSLRESPSSSSKLTPSEKIRAGNPDDTKPPQRSSSVSMRPPGSPVWPPRSLRWSKHWNAPSAPLTVTAKYQPTACSEMWLPVSVSTTLSTLSTVQMPTYSQNQVVLSSAEVTGVCPVEMLPEGSIEVSAASVKMSASSPRVPTPDAVSTTSVKPLSFGDTSKNFVGNPRARKGSSRAARRSSTAPRQPQQSMRWPPRSVKWPNRWNKFSSVSRFSSESSARSTDSTSVPLDTGSVEQPLTSISRTSPRLQRNPPQPQVLERLPVKTIISKDVESSLESSPVSSPLSERSSQWTDSLETSGMSPVGSTQSSSASVWSPSGPTRSPPIPTEEFTLGAQPNKEPGKSERKPSAQKCAVRSTTSSVSSSQTPEKPCGLLLQSTGQSAKARKLQGQSPLRPAVSSSAKRLQRKRSECSKPAADDTSSSLESTTQSLSPTLPLPSTRLLKSEIKLVRSATWPTEIILKPKSTHLLSEHFMTRDSERESPLTSKRMLSEPLRPSSSASAISLLKKSPDSWERQRASDVPLVSPVVVPSASEHRFTQLCGSSTAFENTPILHKQPEMTERPPSSSTKCLSASEKARTSVSSPTSQKYSPALTTCSTMAPSFSDANTSARFVRMTASVPVSQVPTKELKGSIENAAMLLVWPTKSSSTLRAPVLTASTAVQGGSWSYRRSSHRYQVWPQTEGIPVNSLPMSSVSSETLRGSQATFSAGTAILDTTPAYPGVRSADFSQSSSESSKSWPSRTSINVLPTCSPDHLISSVTQLSLSSEEAPVSQKTEQNVPRILKTSSPVPPSLPSGMLPLTESSSVRYLKSNTRAMMAPTLSTKFQSRSAFFESSSDMQLAHSSVTPSWPLLPGTPEPPLMTSLGQSDRYWIEARSCLAEQNPSGSHLPGCNAQTGSYTQSRNPVYAASSTLLQSPKMSSQAMPAESAEMPQRSCPRQSSLCLTPHSPSFQPSSFLNSTTNVIVHTTASFPSLYSSSPSVSCHVTQASAAWSPGNIGKSVTSQAPLISTSNARHVPFAPSVPFVPSGSVAVRSVPSAPLSTKVTDGSEVVPGVSRTAAQLMTPRMWTPLLETPPPTSQRKSLPPRPEINLMWTSNSYSKHPVSSAYTHSQASSHMSDSFPVSKVTSTCTSARLPAPPWSAAASAFPSITSTVTEPRLPTFNWMSSGPFWMPAHSASSSSSSTTTHLITTPAPAMTRSSPTWASSASQLSTIVPSSKGPVVSAVVQTPIPQSEASVSWSRSRPAAWSSTSSASTTGVSGFQTEPSSGLVRLPIKYIKRQPLPRTGDIESANSSNS